MAVRRPVLLEAAAQRVLAALTDHGASLLAAADAAAVKTLLALTKSDVGLGNVDNTSDASKPVSTATQTALNLKANLTANTFSAAQIIQGWLTLVLGESALFINSTTTSLGAYLLLQSNGVNVGSFQAGGSTMAAAYANRMRIRAYHATQGGIDLAAGGSATAQVSVEPSGELRALYNLLVGSSGTALSQVRAYAPNLTPANVAAGTTAEETFAVAGLATTDKLVVNTPSAVAGIGLVGARVSAVNTLALTFSNLTGAPLAPPAGAYPVLAFRS